eukprot:273342-Chlamydomonas_euryale.AAC.12
MARPLPKAALRQARAAARARGVHGTSAAVNHRRSNATNPTPRRRVAPPVAPAPVVKPRAMTAFGRFGWMTTSTVLGSDSRGGVRRLMGAVRRPRGPRKRGFAMCGGDAQSEHARVCGVAVVSEPVRTLTLLPSAAEKLRPPAARGPHTIAPALREATVSGGAAAAAPRGGGRKVRAAPHLISALLH